MKLYILLSTIGVMSELVNSREDSDNLVTLQRGKKKKKAQAAAALQSDLPSWYTKPVTTKATSTEQNITKTTKPTTTNYTPQVTVSLHDNRDHVIAMIEHYAELEDTWDGTKGSI